MPQVPAVSEAKAGDIVVLRSAEEFHPYYLLKLTKDPCEVNEPIKDDYGYAFVTGESVSIGHYSERNSSKTHSYFVDKRKVAVVNALCVIAIAPELEKIPSMKKEQYLVSETVHEVLMQHSL